MKTRISVTTLHEALLILYFIPTAVEMRVLKAVLAIVQEEWWQKTVSSFG